MLTGRPDLQSAQLRERGFREAMADAGVKVRPNYVQVGGYEAGVSAAAATGLLSGSPRPTAVFAANDRSAIATVEAAAALGLRVPDDLSVVGFDNVPEAALSVPPLTTVEQPIHDMGTQAVQMLIKLIQGQEVDPTHVRLPTALVVRQSTGKV
jgi:LacI family transcriptional regulator